MAILVIMKTMTVTELKSQALRVVQDISKSGQTMVITRHGKPIVEIRPYSHALETPTPGRLSHTLIREDDIVSPLGAEMWESAR